MAVGGPLALVWGPILYVFLAIISLSQFKIAYALLMRAAFSKSDNPLLQAAQQALKQQLGLAEAVFGQPQTFTPSATHVFLVALMICIIVNRR